MTQQDLPIIYYGTAHFAVGCLRALVENNFNVVAVVTATDKPAGRGYKLQPSPVKEYALSVGLPLLQPASLKDPEFLASVQALKPAVGVVVAFRMMPQVLWSIPPLGTLNVHGSLLPQLRGAAPINWALMHGFKETGVTLFRLKHEIDTGDIIATRSCSINDEINFGTLYEELMALGSDMLVNALFECLEQNGELNGTPQKESSSLLPAPKLDKVNTRIDWNRSAQEIHNLVRGLDPLPGAWTTLNSVTSDDTPPTPVHIYKTYILCPETLPSPQQPIGKLFVPHKGSLAVQTGHGLLGISALKPRNKKMLSASDFINGSLREQNGLHPQLQME